MRRVLLPIALVAALVSAIAVYLGHYGTDVFAVYLVSVLCVVLALSGRVNASWLRLDRRRLASLLPILLLVSLQLALAYYFGSFPLQHFHQDEFETAFASYSLPDVTQIQWFVGYPRDGTWVTQFPILFFALQKPFFMLLGPTVEAVRVSVWPYLALSVVYLYLLAREISPRPAFPAVAALCAMLLAPSLYIDSLGVQFHSSTLFLIASLYYVVVLLRTERRGYAILAGLFCGLAYLAYSASYITMPLLVGFVAFEALVRRSSRPFRLFWPSLVVFAFVVLPFVVFALTKHNYFLDRVGQLNAFTGTAFPDPELERLGAPAFLLGQLAVNLRSLVEPNIVGPGYAFGRQAFFDRAGFALFVLGLGYGALLVLRGASRTPVLVGAALLTAFLSGMVVMLPAGAFHRVTLVYPLVGLVVALGLLAIYEAAEALLARTSIARPVAVGVAVVALAAFSVLNAARAYEMTVHDQTHDSPSIYRYLEENVPASKTVGIAFAWNYHLGHELFFRTGGRKFVTGSVADIVDDPPSDVIVLAYPSLQTVLEVRARFPGATFVAEVDGVRMSDHYVVLTRGNQVSAR